MKNKVIFGIFKALIELRMKYLFGILLFLSAKFAFAQDTIIFKNCEVISIDSINYCSTHYAILLLTDVDTFSTLIEKNDLQQNLSELIGNHYNVETFYLDSARIGVCGKVYFFKPFFSIATHMPNGAISKRAASYKWKIKPRKWHRKEKFELRLSNFYMQWEGRPLIVKNLQQSTTP